MCTDWTAANPLATRANAASFCWLKHCQEWKVQGRRWNAKHWKTSANVPALFYPACDGQFLHNLYPVNSVCWGRETLGLQTIKHLQLNLGPDAECLQGTVCHQTYAISPSLLIVTLSATLFHSGVLPQCKTTLACYCDVRPSSVTPVWFCHGEVLLCITRQPATDTPNQTVAQQRLVMGPGLRSLCVSDRI